MRLSNQLVLASNNRHKLEEFQRLFAPYPEIQIVPAKKYVRNIDKLEHVENYSTYLENAVAKARFINLACHYPSLADDSGLEVMALEGQPGVRSARFAVPRPNMTRDQANRIQLLEKLKNAQNRDARFVCELSLVIEGVEINARGEIEGTITESEKGDGGFGYDPIFIPKGFSKTFSEMNAADKNSVSHRAKAVEVLMQKAKEYGVVFAKP